MKIKSKINAHTMNSILLKKTVYDMFESISEDYLMTRNRKGLFRIKSTEEPVLVEVKIVDSDSVMLNIFTEIGGMRYSFEWDSSLMVNGVSLKISSEDIESQDELESKVARLFADAMTHS